MTASRVLLAALVMFATAIPVQAAGLSELIDRYGEVRIEAHAPSEYDSAAAAYREILTDLEALDREALSPADRLDVELLEAKVETRRFEIEDLELHRLVPVRYLALWTTNSLFVRPCSQPDAVVKRAVTELERFPEILANARENLTRPARVWTENAIATAGFAETMLRDDLDTVCVDDPAVRADLRASGDAALEALLDFVAWLESELLPRSDRSPAWSPDEIEHYQFVHERLDDYGVDEMIRIAAEDEVATEAEMLALASRIHPSADLRTVWELMKDETPPWSEVRPMAERYVELADDWIRGPGSHLLVIPERFDYGVQITAPMGRRLLSFGGASYGPTIGGRISGYYVLTPIEDGLSEADRASRLRSYNPYWTHVISYHEWIGHNVQRAFAEANVTRPMRQRYGSIYLSQAWSFYLERLLEDEGYFEAALPHMEALKTRMARLQMRMWRVQRILTKLRMAKGEMTFDEAVTAYVEKIGMEPTNAFIEVQRDSQSPSPPGREIIGEAVIEAMRDEWFRRLGPHARLRDFHEALLREGELPLPVVRDLMFGDL